MGTGFLLSGEVPGVLPQHREIFDGPAPSELPRLDEEGHHRSEAKGL
jgi:hypothetical protein